MNKTKKIPCRVCGKYFKPCAYCQSHADTFRWRNFACSKECATKYIGDTIAYRESLKKKDEVEVVANETMLEPSHIVENVAIEEKVIVEKTNSFVPQKNVNKKFSNEEINNEIKDEKKETEKTDIVY